jgi:hypothetical protein
MSAAPKIRDDSLSEVSRRGLAIYEDRLRTILEPEANGKVVAIDVDTGDYAVADTSPAAMRLMLRRNPDAVLVMRTIGPERRHGLVARALSSPLPTGDPT